MGEWISSALPFMWREIVVALSIVKELARVHVECSVTSSIFYNRQLPNRSVCWDIYDIDISAL